MNAMMNVHWLKNPRRKVKVLTSVTMGLSLALGVSLSSCSKSDDAELYEAKAEAAKAKAELEKLKAEAAAKSGNEAAQSTDSDVYFKANEEAQNKKALPPKALEELASSGGSSGIDASAASSAPMAPSAPTSESTSSGKAASPPESSFAAEETRFREPPSLSHIPTAGTRPGKSSDAPAATSTASTTSEPAPAESNETRKRISAIDAYYTARYGESPSVQINNGNYVKYDGYADGFNRALNGAERPSESDAAQGWEDGNIFRRTNNVPSTKVE